MVHQSGWLKTRLFISPEERFVFLQFGLRSCTEACSVMGEACYAASNITWTESVNEFYFQRFSLTTFWLVQPWRSVIDHIELKEKSVESSVAV
jgi:hypothetical protein